MESEHGATKGGVGAPQRPAQVGQALWNHCEAAGIAWRGRSVNRPRGYSRLKRYQAVGTAFLTDTCGTCQCRSIPKRELGRIENPGRHSHRVGISGDSSSAEPSLNCSKTAAGLAAMTTDLLP